MSKNSRLFIFLLSCIAAALVARPAFAVIAVELPLSKVYSKSAIVVLATVTKVEGEGKGLEIELGEALRGQSPGPKARLLIRPEALRKQFVVGQPAVLFINRGGPTGIHLADTWMVAQAQPQAPLPTWIIEGEHDLKKSFPGRTPALVQLLKEMKAGKPTILDTIHDVLRSEPKKLGAITLKDPSSLAALDADKFGPMVLVGYPGGTHSFMLGGKDPADMGPPPGTQGAGPLRAAGDINNDNRPDLLLGDTLFINGPTNFEARGKLDLPPDTLAAAMLNNPNGPQILAITKTGSLLSFTFANNTVTKHDPRPLDSNTDPILAACFGQFEDGFDPSVILIRESGLTRCRLTGDAMPADFTRLTGQNLSSYLRDTDGKIKNPAATSIDVNGDGKTDLLLLCDGGGLLLVNRGFGAFLPSSDTAKHLHGTAEKPAPYKLSPSTRLSPMRLAPNTHDDLLILSDSQLYQIPNPPQAAK